MKMKLAKKFLARKSIPPKNSKNKLTSKQNNTTNQTKKLPFSTRNPCNCFTKKTHYIDLLVKMGAKQH